MSENILDVIDLDGPSLEAWKDRLIVRTTKTEETILSRVHNIALILENADHFRGRISYDLFSHKIHIDGEPIDDIAPIRIQAHLERHWINEKISDSDLYKGMRQAADRNAYHPVKMYLEGLEWDEKPRLEHLFSDYAETADDLYHRHVAVSLFVSAVARIYQPGCKVDTMVILQGAQGAGKTRFFLTMFSPWCFEVTASLDSKDFFQGLKGCWAADFGELSAFSRSDSSRIKQVLTQTKDHYRPSYGKEAVTYERQCVFVGSTNLNAWQGDATGGRRFLPVKIPESVDIDGLHAVRGQIWAEALVRYKEGVKWWDIPDAESHQEDVYQGDAWENIVERWLIETFGAPHDESTLSGYLRTCELEGLPTVSLILKQALEVDIARQTRSDQTRLGAIMHRLGWRTVRLSRGYKQSRARAYQPSVQWLNSFRSTPLDF